MPENNEPENIFDVVVIGGGPAGATVSAFLARRGRRVALVDKDQHPRFHIGESLLPKVLPVFERLGVSSEISRIGLRKPGAEFVSPDHDRRQCFSFDGSIDPKPSYAYQVERAAFDEILFRHAGSCGATVWENCEVVDSARTAEGWRLRIDGPGNGPEKSKLISARYMIDSSGRDGFMARHNNLRIRDKNHNSAALFAHFRHVDPGAWETPGDITVFWFDHGWIWMIPLPNGVTSVGAVCSADYIKSRKGTLEAFFSTTLDLCPNAAQYMTEATRMTPVHGTGNYAYSAESAFGDKYLLLGDAYAFLDPIFSTGVLLAMISAERAANILDIILDNPERTPSLQSQYQKDLDRAIKRIAWFIYRFNTPTMRRLLMDPKNYLGVRTAVSSLLTGDLYRGSFFDWRLGVFKFIYTVSRIKNGDANTTVSYRAPPAVSPSALKF